MADVVEPQRASRARLTLLAVSIVAISLAHYLTPPDHFVLHNVFQRLYYVPVLIAAVTFGMRGGIAFALLAAAAYAPHIAHDWTHHGPYRTAQWIELVMFVVLATLVGRATDNERRERRRAEATARERDAALRDLEATLDDLRRADRLAALGTMAAGIAHDLRNPLGGIAGAVDILESDYPQDHPRREFLEIVRREVDRLNALTSRYVDFARPAPPEPRPVDFTVATRQAADLVRRMAERRGVTVELQASDPAAVAKADPVQMHQAIVNLLLNAVQAMPQGGPVEVEVRRNPGEVEIAVRDRGPGIREQDRDRIFEPFYTTRSHGTGLGLATSRRIVESHGGRITVENREGGGAEFVLHLPAA